MRWSVFLVNLLIGLITSAPALAKSFGAESFFVCLGLVVSALVVLGLYNAVRGVTEWNRNKRMLRRLLAREPGWPGGDWTLPAPEAAMLLHGVRRASRDAFKLGLLQLVAAGVLKPEEKRGDSKGGSDRETILSRGPRGMEAVTGSLVPLFALWAASSQPTIKELASQARQKYGSLDGFGTKAVLPELVKAGLYGLHPAALTSPGEAARTDLESRMAGVLREMQQRRGSWVDRKPAWVLTAAIIAVAAGRMRPVAENELQLAGQQVERAASMPHDPIDQSGIWYDWDSFSHFDTYFQTMGPEIDGVDCGLDGICVDTGE